MSYTIVSSALFGYRKNRDAKDYYRLLINDLAEKSEQQIVVATNEPVGFDKRIELVPVTDIHALRSKLWPSADWREQALTRIFWHPRNACIDLYANVDLVSVYLAKMSLIFQFARHYGDVVWLDAGFLFSQIHDHSVPSEFPGYSRDKINGIFSEKMEERSRIQSPLFVKIPRDWRGLKNRRPHFHGMSYNDMTRLAKRCTVEPRDYYIQASAMFLPSALADQGEKGFRSIWQNMLAMGRCSTEEPALSILCWQNHWDAMTIRDWTGLVYSPEP